MSTKHSKAATALVADTARTYWHDQALFVVWEKRDRMAEALPKWEALRETASQIKLHTLTLWSEYLQEFEKKLPPTEYRYIGPKMRKSTTSSCSRLYAGIKAKSHQKQIHAYRRVRHGSFPRVQRYRSGGKRPGPTDHAAHA